MRWISWQNYAEARFEGERVQLDHNLDGSWEQQVALSAALRLHANPDISGAGLQFGSARLEKLQLKSGAQITFSRPEEADSQFRLSVQQATELKGDLTFPTA
ncbi:MAG: hypothetical protein SH848_05635 [Saprospiraceae bacterium]|nr:hypothetical protein [Saprospiraceae bacterium]MDZ4703388.1 hypothetical protein [Saprospiraceae bacterium]